ncbi:MAG TPA: phosphate/phosphite/phosphonate ABC transporter substrate-binding protein [Bacilli bacterium]|nr:phosphate/phosphite/phosphonate ABC transporter substrate-binding protein [Bacilli bacterium]
MKKVFVVLILMFAAFAFVGCEQSGDPDVIKVQFVPSQNASEIMLKTKALEALLAERVPGKKFEISVGTDYTAVVEGMSSGQVHVGFLTAQQYAFVTTDRPGTAEVILTSVRAALQVQLLPWAEQKDAMNAAGYAAQKSTTETATNYSSILLTKTATYNLTGAGKINTVADLAGKTVCVQNVTSGSGYVYPAVLLDQNGLKFVTGTPNATAGEVKALTTANHPAGVTGLMNNDCDAAFVFQDARDNATLLATYPNLFTDTRVVALTPAIYNDTISVIPSLSAELKAQIQAAFIDLATTEAGLAAISVYQHTGYKVAVDSDYDGERLVYVFKKNNLS